MNCGSLDTISGFYFGFLLDDDYHEFPQHQGLPVTTRRSDSSNCLDDTGKKSETPACDHLVSEPIRTPKSITFHGAREK
jgi:hypothetical protein